MWKRVLALLLSQSTDCVCVSIIYAVHSQRERAITMPVQQLSMLLYIYMLYEERVCMCLRCVAVYLFNFPSRSLCPVLCGCGLVYSIAASQPACNQHNQVTSYAITRAHCCAFNALATPTVVLVAMLHRFSEAESEADAAASAKVATAAAAARAVALQSNNCVSGRNIPAPTLLLVVYNERPSDGGLGVFVTTPELCNVATSHHTPESERETHGRPETKP